MRHRSKGSAGETTKPIGNPVRHAGKYIVLTYSVKKPWEILLKLSKDP